MAHRGARILLVLALLVPASAQNRDANSIATLQSSVRTSISKLDRSLVAIVAVGRGGPLVIGTGFVVGDDGTFVTASHVLRQPDDVQVRALMHPSAGAPQAAVFETLLDDRQRDIVICRMVSGHGMRWPVVPVALADTSKSESGTFVIASGFPLTSERPSSHFGIVSTQAPGDQLVEIGVMVNEGESGAPVARIEDGKVIGMVSSVRTASTFQGAGQGVEDQNSGLTLAVPSEWLAALIAKAKQQAHSAR